MARPPGRHTAGWTWLYRRAEVSELPCARCGQMKPLDAFGVLRTGSRASYCRDCAARLNREWRARKREAKP